MTKLKFSVKFTSAFKKNRKLMIKRGMDIKLLNDVILKLANGEPLDVKYKDHKLTGNFSKFRECHIQPNWILIYYIENNILTLTCVNTGTHSDLFNM